MGERKERGKGKERKKRKCFVGRYVLRIKNLEYLDR